MLCVLSPKHTASVVGIIPASALRSSSVISAADWQRAGARFAMCYDSARVLRPFMNFFAGAGAGFSLSFSTHPVVTRNHNSVNLATSEMCSALSVLRVMGPTTLEISEVGTIRFSESYRKMALDKVVSAFQAGGCARGQGRRN